MTTDGQAVVRDMKVELIATIRKHLAPGGRRGVIVITTDYTNESPTQSLWSVNSSRFHMQAGAVNLLKFTIEALQDCECGDDHRLEIAELRAVVARLEGATWPGQVPN